LSRRLEAAADRYALELAGKGEAFLSAMERLGELNLAEKEVSPMVEFLFHSHPSLARRMEAARTFIQKGQG
jgi:STE24 endopeptidase